MVTLGDKLYITPSCWVVLTLFVRAHSLCVENYLQMAQGCSGTTEPNFPLKLVEKSLGQLL